MKFKESNAHNNDSTVIECNPYFIIWFDSNISRWD